MSCYHGGCAAVNLSAHLLPDDLSRFYRRILSLSGSRGFCYVTTSFLAGKQVSRRAGIERISRVTAWRWLRELEEGGFIRVEPIPGSHRRKITPLLKPAGKIKEGEPGFVYLVEAAGVYKIGRTMNLKERLKTLATGSFEPYRVNLEWFGPTDEHIAQFYMQTEMRFAGVAK